MPSNIVTVALKAGCDNRTEPMYQYDYGQILRILGVTLPEAYEVHFSNSLRGESTTSIGNADGVAIPDEYLTAGVPVYAWLFLHTGEDDGETEYRIIIPVIARAKPTNAEPTPVQQDAITQAIAALNTAVEETAQSAQAADQYADEAAASAEQAEQDAYAAQGYAEQAKASEQAAQTAKLDAETAAGNAATSEQNATQSATEAATSATEAEAARDTITGMRVTAQTLPAGSQATASWSDGTLALGIPRGDKGNKGDTGDKGDKGDTGATGAQGEKGDKGDTGDTGATGPQGEDGFSPTVTVTEITGGHEVTITDAEGDHTFDVQNGELTMSDLSDAVAYDQPYKKNSFWNIESETAVRSDLSSHWVSFDPIFVRPGQVWTVQGRQGNSDKVRIWAVVDEDYTILAMAENHKSSAARNYTETFTVPEGGVWLLVCSYYSAVVKITQTRTVMDRIHAQLLEGKTVAIIGDSISTNGSEGEGANAVEITVGEADVGVELSAYLTYYDVQAGLSLGGHTFTSAEIGQEVTFTPVAEDVGKVIGLANNYNVDSVKTWWEVAQDALGFKAISVCWSGASVTSHEAATQDYAICAHAYHPSQIRKCGIRKAGSMERTAPDYIILYRGTNDFSHTPYALLTDNYFSGAGWDYPATDAVSGGYGFLEGIALTVKALRTAYPDAKIFLSTLNVFKRVSYAHFPTNNGINSLPEYNAAIRAAADFFGCGVIDFEKDGITFENCYSSGYITDSATTPTHPSKKGHAAMGKRAILDLSRHAIV